MNADAVNVTTGLAVRSRDGVDLGTVASTVIEGGQLKTVMIKGADGVEFGLQGGAFTVKEGAVVAAWSKAEIDKARAGVAPPPRVGG